MNLLLIFSTSSFSTPFLVHSLYPANSSRADFPHCPIFGLYQMIVVLPNVQSTLLLIYISDIRSTRSFLNFIMVSILIQS